MNTVIPTVGVVVLRNLEGREEVLLVKHQPAADHVTGVYGLPAGRIEQNESKIDAAIRELHEETGLRTTKNYLVELPEHYQATILRKDGQKTFSLTAYICKNFFGQLKKSNETVPEWIKISDLENYELLPNIKSAIDDSLCYVKENRIPTIRQRAGVLKSH